MSHIKKIWERLPGETSASYKNFCAYRDMVAGPGEKRSLRLLAQLLGKSHKTLGLQSSKYNWVERCDAYDDELECRARAKREKELLKMRADHALLGNSLVKKAVQGLVALQPGDIGPKDVARLADVGVKIERLSRGESTENQSVKTSATVHHSGQVTAVVAPLDLSALSDKELDSLERILQKIADNRDIQPSDAAENDSEGTC